MPEIKWIKISTTIFDDEKIKLIEAMPDRDAILIIWIKLITQAGKSNASGLLLLNQNIPYTDEMLSTIFNRPIATVRMALSIFEKFGMIEFAHDAIVIPNWEKHQSIDKMDVIRDQSRIRQQKRREKQRLLMEKNKDVTRDSNVTVTSRNALEVEVEVEVDIDKEVVVVDLYKEKWSEQTTTAATFIPEKTYQENIGLITPIVAESIKHWIDDGVEASLICRYIEVAVKRNKRNWAYIEKMISGNFHDGIVTLRQYEAICVGQKQSNEYNSPYRLEEV